MNWIVVQDKNDETAKTKVEGSLLLWGHSTGTPENSQDSKLNRGKVEFYGNESETKEPSN